jgi:acetyl-CoA carboxylase carboxyltransferase component
VRRPRNGNCVSPQESAVLHAPRLTDSLRLPSSGSGHVFESSAPRELEKIADETARAEARARFTAEYRERFANPYKAASLGYIDEIIRPRDTRHTIIRALVTLANKRQSNPPRKHGNIPL